MMTTREVAKQLGIKVKTLQLWVREGYVSPEANGEGSQRRLTWDEDAIEQARRMRDRGDSDMRLVASMGPKLIAALNRAREMRDFKSSFEVIIASDQRSMVFQDDAPLSEVLRRIGGDFLILLR